ncbi:unnamed protein product [Symbiodinium sp. KB8]|nr:unnamed protein product [Symbiodinium sp. KB8]
MPPKRGPAEGAADTGKGAKKPRTSTDSSKGSGKGQLKGSTKSAGAEQHPTKGSGKQSKGGLKGSVAAAEEHPTPKGAGKQSKGEQKGSGAAAEHPTPKGSGKQSKGELKGSSVAAEEHPKGSGKQSKGKGNEHPTAKGSDKGEPKGSGKSNEHPQASPVEKHELRNLNPESMRRFFDCETYAKGSTKSAGPAEHPIPKGSGKQSKGKGEQKGSTKSAAPEEHPTTKGSSKGKGEQKGSGKSAAAEEHPTKGSGKQSTSKGELKGSGKNAAAEEHPTKGSGKQSTSKGEPKGSGKSAATEEHPTPKGAGKQSKGEQKGSSAAAEEHPTPKGSGKQSQGELKGSSVAAEEHPSPKGSGKQSHGEPKGSTKSAGPADPKGSGKQSKGKGTAKGSKHGSGDGGGNKGVTKALLKTVHEEAAELCNTQHEHDEQQHWQYNIYDMTMRGEIQDSDFTNPLVILPTCVLGELANMQAKQPRLCQQRLRSITEHEHMFRMFKNWQAQQYPNHKTVWGQAPAAQIMQHNKFLVDVVQGAMEPSTEIEADATEEGEEELQEEPEEEYDHEDEASDWVDDGAADDDDDDGDDDEAGIPTSGYPDEIDPAGALEHQRAVGDFLNEPDGLAGPRGQGEVRVLDEATRSKIQAMTHPNEMDAAERRRQREAMRRFEFLKAFMLDSNMSGMHIESHYSTRRSEVKAPSSNSLSTNYKKNTRRQKKENDFFRLYKVYQHGKEISANVSKVGTKIKARKQVGKADEATRKKLGEVITSQAADFVKGTEVLTEEEIKKKDFDKTMAQILALAGKARTAAQNLTRSGLKRQEAWILFKLNGYTVGYPHLHTVPNRNPVYGTHPPPAHPPPELLCMCSRPKSKTCRFVACSSIGAAGQHQAHV